MVWLRISPASQFCYAARPAMWRREAPTRPACDSRVHEGSVARFATLSTGPSIQKPACDAAVAVNAAVAQKGPVTADIFQVFQIALANQDLLFVMRRLNNDPSKGIAKEGAAPELQAFTCRAIAPDVTHLMSHAVDRTNKNAIGDGVRPLDRTPCIMLRCAEFSLLIGVPADRRRIKEDIGALQSSQA